MSQSQIDALLIERAGYERRGLTDRIAQVDESLRALGYEQPKRTPEQTASTRGRRTAKA